MLTDETARIAHRLLREMIHVAEANGDMKFFQGVGMSLAIVFEEVTGQSAKNLTPKQVMQWAMRVPEPEKSRII